MKAKINYKSKKTIIIAVIIIALIILSGLAVGLFLKGNDNTEAVGSNTTGNTINNNTDENTTSNNQTENTHNNDVNTGNTAEKEDTNNKQNEQENNNQNKENVNNDENQENTGAANNQENVNNENADNADNANNQENANNENANNANNNQNVPNQEYVSERVEIIPERVISETYVVSWEPTELRTLVDGEITIEKANIVAEKTVAKLTTNGLEKNPESVKVGEILQYIIKLTNTNSKVNGLVNVTDAIPAGTEFVSATQSNLKTTPAEYENASEVTQLEWKNVKVEAGSQVALVVYVKVVAKAEVESTTIDTTSVQNIAKIYDGTTPEEEIPSPETKVANITSNKTSTIIYNEEKPHEHIAVEGKEQLHEQDIIEYTITLTNVGKADGTVEVSDTVPEGTTLIKDGVVTVIDQNGTATYEMSELVEGIDVTVAAANEGVAGFATVTFRVIVNSFDEETKVIRNDMAKVDEIPTNTTEDSADKVYIDIPVTKTWDKINNDAAKVYALNAIKFQVKKGTTVVADKVVAAVADEATGIAGNWTYTFENLPKYDENGTEIDYTVIELSVNDEEQEILDTYYNVDTKYVVGTGENLDTTTVTIVNTFDTSEVQDETISITARKDWANMGSDAAKDYTMTTITLQVRVYAEDGSYALAAIKEVTGPNWTAEFTGLKKYDINGNKINYVVDEVVTKNADETIESADAEKLAAYDKNVTTQDDGTVVITNTFNPSKVQDDTTEITATKEWLNMGSDAAKDYTLSSITIQVKLNGEVVESKVITAPDWKAQFTGLKKYDENGKLLEYTIDEVVTENADKTIEAADAAKLAAYDKVINGNKITNTFNPSKVQDDTTEVTIKKVWEDNSNAFETRPQNVVLTIGGTQQTLTASNDEDTTTSDEWTLTVELPKYNADGSEISYTATEVNVPEGYTKQESGLTVTNTADVIVEKSVYTSNADGSIGSEADGTEKFKAGDIIYYTLSFKNAGNTVIESKTLTDTISLKLNLIGIGSITQLIDSETSLSTGTDDYGYTWEVTENENGNKVVNWTLTNVEPGGFRQLIIKTRISGEVEYQEIHQKIGVETQHTATLYVRKDGKVPYNGSGLSDTTADYTNSLGTVYLHSDKLSYNAQENLKSDDIFYALKNNHYIVDMVSKAITRAELKTALQQNGMTLESDEIVLWYTIKNENNEYKIYGVIRKITDPELSEITNAVCMDQVKHDETKIDLEEIIIAQDGTVTINVNSTTTENVAVPMDVVLVLDVSGSMDGSNANHMVSAVNSSISTILEEDPDTRIGIVTFSDEVEVLVPLGNYLTTENYLTHSRTNWYSTSKITENVTGNSNSVYTSGGTYTQAGIKAGAEMLTSQSVITFQTTTQSGATVSGTRTPVLILITDGDPTYYNDKADLSGNNRGNGSDTSASHCYWTIRTAKHYKDAITTKYYGTTPQKQAKFFTIGIGMDGELATTTLNPNQTNVDALRYETDRWGNRQEANSDSSEMRLYNLLNTDGTPYAYDYADGSKTGALTENDLETFITTSLEASAGVTVVRAITDEETTSRRINLTHIDISQAFMLEIIGETTQKYTTLEEAKNAGYVKIDSETGEYYVDLTNIVLDTTVNINYWHKHT